MTPFLTILFLAWSTITQCLAFPHPLKLPSNLILPRQPQSPPPITQAYLPPPTLDPFYSPPLNWTSSTPGTVLRLRSPAYPTINIKNCRSTIQILYRTSDSHNSPSFAVTTIFFPTSLSSSNNIVLYQVPTDSVSPDAQPSYLLQALEPYGEIRDLLARGYIISVPDYNGPLASYCAGAQAGHATLDSIRAAISSSSALGVDEQKLRFAIWGYSGGGFAAGFALELLPTYAPDLLRKVVGAAVGGPAPNLTTVTQKMNKRDTTGLAVAALVGVTMQWPGAKKHLQSRLKKEGKYNATGFNAIKKMTGIESLAMYAHQDLYEYFVDGEKDVWDPVVQSVIDKDSVMGVRGAPPPEIPVFLYKAAADEMSGVEESDHLVETYCSQGSRVLYHRNQIGGHNDELWSGRLRTMDFLAHVLNDRRSANMTVPEVGECLTQNVSVPLDVWGLLPEWWWGIP
ncbi:lipase 2 [Podospora australis]|uniref:Lipase 2 n=1 Tax=Podospora australis TaxID=1536484 RepID=A0AAN6WMZ3_9PEZI|nr:lipase 2 [Podospora australis]